MYCLTIPITIGFVEVVPSVSLHAAPAKENQALVIFWFLDMNMVLEYNEIHSNLFR